MAGLAVAYFEELLAPGSNNNTEPGHHRGAYITVGVEGRVRGSGEGSPFWDVLLSTFPQQAVDPLGTLSSQEKQGGTASSGGAAADNEAVEAVIALHKQFYQHLDTGDNTAMQGLWCSPAAVSPALTDYSGRGASLDGWDVVLKEGRRPIGMSVSDVDVLVEPCGTHATLTCIETVAGGSTLLATQRFVCDESGKWSLVGHKTIPYGKEIVAKVVLECDARGCVALPAKAVTSTASASTFQLK